uniref:Uncharacterized protein n=1 Tax=Magallana gigas TaxID=29159 RepID=K1QPY0_MAGGI
MITEHSAPETRQFQLMQADKRQALLGIMSTVSLVEGKSQCRLVCRQTTSGPRRCHVNQNETCGGISPERPALVPVIRAVGAGISRWWGSWGIRLSTAGASTTGNLCVLNRCAAGPKKID